MTIRATLKSTVTEAPNRALRHRPSQILQITAATLALASLFACAEPPAPHQGAAATPALAGSSTAPRATTVAAVTPAAAPAPIPVLPLNEAVASAVKSVFASAPSA